MEDFDYEKNTREEKEKKLYEQTSEKQAKIAKNIITIVFCSLGGLYLVIGLVALLAIEDEESNIVGYVFGGLGILFLFLGILLHFVLPKKGNYERFKRQSSTFGYVNNYDLAARVEMLREQNRALEDRVESLERKVRELESR